MISGPADPKSSQAQPSWVVGPSVPAVSRLGQLVDGEFLIKGILGQGELGVTYEADNTRLKRRFAVLILSRESKPTHAMMLAVRDDLRRAQQLTAAGLMPVKTIADKDGIPGFATELLEGETLRVRLGRSPLSVERALAVTLSVARTLEAAHKVGLIHGDLRPENIFLVRPSAKSSAAGKVMVVEHALHHLRRRAAGLDDRLPLYKLMYRPPEQVMGEAGATEQGDVWVLGAILYECLTGKPAFYAEEPEFVLDNLGGSPPPLQASPAIGLSATLAATLNLLLSRVCVRDLESRLPNMGELVAAIEQLVRGASLKLPEPIVESKEEAAAAAPAQGPTRMAQLLTRQSGVFPQIRLPADPDAAAPAPAPLSLSPTATRQAAPVVVTPPSKPKLEPILPPKDRVNRILQRLSGTFPVISGPPSDEPAKPAATAMTIGEAVTPKRNELDHALDLLKKQHGLELAAAAPPIAATSPVAAAAAAGERTTLPPVEGGPLVAPSAVVEPAPRAAAPPVAAVARPPVDSPPPASSPLASESRAAAVPLVDSGPAPHSGRVAAAAKPASVAAPPAAPSAPSARSAPSASSAPVAPSTVSAPKPSSATSAPAAPSASSAPKPLSATSAPAAPSASSAPKPLSATSAAPSASSAPKPLSATPAAPSASSAPRAPSAISTPAAAAVAAPALSSRTPRLAPIAQAGVASPLVAAPLAAPAAPTLVAGAPSAPTLIESSAAPSLPPPSTPAASSLPVAAAVPAAAAPTPRPARLAREATLAGDELAEVIEPSAPPLPAPAAAEVSSPPVEPPPDPKTISDFPTSPALAALAGRLGALKPGFPALTEQATQPAIRRLPITELPTYAKLDAILPDAPTAIVAGPLLPPAAAKLPEPPPRVQDPPTLAGLLLTEIEPSAELPVSPLPKAPVEPTPAAAAASGDEKAKPPRLPPVAELIAAMQAQQAQQAQAVAPRSAEPASAIPAAATPQSSGHNRVVTPGRASPGSVGPAPDLLAALPKPVPVAPAAVSTEVSSGQLAPTGLLGFMVRHQELFAAMVGAMVVMFLTIIYLLLR